MTTAKRAHSFTVLTHLVRQMTKCLAVVLLIILLSAPCVLAQEPQRAQPEVQIILQPEQVRFTAPANVEQMRLQVFAQNGELVYDSQPLALNQLNWLWLGADGAPVKSGLYAYTLTIKTTGAATERVRRGHFIIDRAQEREAQTDRVWLTSPDDTGVGTELTVSQSETGAVAGVRTVSDRAGTSGRETARTVEENDKSAQQTSQAIAAALAGTIGKLAKFTTATEVSDSVVTEAGGNIGIGVAAPKHRLSIVGGPLWTANDWSGSMELVNGSAIAWQTNNAGQRAGIGHTNGGTLFFRTASDPGTAASPANYDMTINDVGNVGIGTTVPQNRLHVGSGSSSILASRVDAVFAGNKPDAGIAIAQNGGVNVLVQASGAGGFIGTTSNHLLSLRTNDLDRVVVAANGNLGVGTGAPVVKLHVLGNGIRFENGGRILDFNSGTEVDVRSPTSSVVIQSTGAATHNHVVLQPFANNGNVGIGTFLPGAKLEVIGRTRTGSLEITGGADFAENFDINTTSSRHSATLPVAPGMVVAIDPTRQGKLTLSRRAYDRRVAGIVSGAGGVLPGLTMGQEQTLADGKYPVALSGRVYVWADATRGAIKSGDLLTTSATPGHAMRVGNPAKAQGAIIGKAMTGLKSGKGLVLVLVTLQ